MKKMRHVFWDKSFDWYKKFIIIEKYVKGWFLLLLSISVLPHVSKSIASQIIYISKQTHVFSNGAFLEHYFTLYENSRVHTKFEFAVVLLVWGIFELSESIGLYNNKRWSEYLIIGSNMLFLPVEIQTLIHKFTIERLIFFLFNIAVVVYLSFDLRRRVIHHRRKIQSENSV